MPWSKPAPATTSSLPGTEGKSSFSPLDSVDLSVRHAARIKTCQAPRVDEHGNYERDENSKIKLCGNPLPDPPGRGRHKYCPEHAPSARRKQWSEDTKNRREKEAYLLREELGDDSGFRYRALENLRKWLWRHGDISRRFFLKDMSKVLIATCLENTPTDPASYETYLQQELVHGWQLFAQGREAEANLKAQTLLGLIEIRPTRSSRRIALACQELLLDTASETTAPLRVTCQRLGDGCEKLIVEWKEADEPVHFISAIERYANCLRAYPWVRRDSHSLALTLFEVADRFCKLANPHDLKWLMLRREAAHRNFQLLTVAGHHRKAERELELLADLSEAIASPVALVHNLEVRATHYSSTGQSDKAHDCLAAAWSKAEGAALSPWTWFSLLRADIDHCIREGLNDRLHQRADQFDELLEEHLFPYQQNQRKRWRPWAPAFRGPYRMVAALPPLADLFILDI